MPLLEAHFLAHSFESELFSELSFSAESGESISVMGASGSGKSTLLHILSTLLKPKKGEVALFGDSIYSLPQDKLLKLRREKIGIIFQSHYLFRGFSGRENLEVASILSNQAIDDTTLENLGIKQVINQNISTLSGGQQQRLSIARVLTKKPKIIFADEPTGNLDKDSANGVMEALFEYVVRENALLFLITHDEHLAKRCLRTYCLEDRRLLPWS